MQLDLLFALACGYEDDGQSFRLYVDSPTPALSYTRDRGRRTELFHLFSGDDAEAIRQWLRQHRAWECLRVPADFTPARGVRAIQIAFHWHSGGGSPLYRFASTRRVHDDAHREQAYREVNHCIEAVLENPVGPDELADLRLLAEVILTASVAVELAASHEVFPDTGDYGASRRPGRRGKVTRSDDGPQPGGQG